MFEFCTTCPKSQSKRITPVNTQTTHTHRVVVLNLKVKSHGLSTNQYVGGAENMLHVVQHRNMNMKTREYKKNRANPLSLQSMDVFPPCPASRSRQWLPCSAASGHKCFNLEPRCCWRVDHERSFPIKYA